MGIDYKGVEGLVEEKGEGEVYVKWITGKRYHSLVREAQGRSLSKVQDGWSPRLHCWRWAGSHEPALPGHCHCHCGCHHCPHDPCLHSSWCDHSPLCCCSLCYVRSFRKIFFLSRWLLTSYTAPLGRTSLQARWPGILRNDVYRVSALYHTECNIQNLWICTLGWRNHKRYLNQIPVSRRARILVAK